MRSIEFESRFPSQPVEPRVFVEDVIPSLFADLDLTAAERELDLRLGIVLRGEGGGEWTLHFVDGELGIEGVRAGDCDVTLVQSVEDWRSALWAGRPAFVGDVLNWLQARGSAGRDPLLRARKAPLEPRVVEELRSLRGLVEIRVEQSLGAGAAEPADWRLWVRLGPGIIPAEADATISLGADQAEAIHRGELHPIEALITGQLRLEGDLGLIVQLQAIAMQSWLPR